jgi:glycosyltransferase involved in cell wall biosynthesis
MRPSNILVMTYWSYNDALIQTYTLPYVKQIARQLPAGSKIFLSTLDREPLKPLPDLSEWNIEVISIAYRPFAKGSFMWLGAFMRLVRLIRREKIHTIHAWCTTAGSIGTLLAWLTRRRLIIDSYEPHAEAMVENGSWKPNGIPFRVLMHFEKKLTHRAAYLISATEGMKNYAREKYGHRKDNFFVKPACVDLELFSEKNIKKPALLKELGLEGKIVCVYAGKLGGIYLDKEVFAFFAAAQQHWNDDFHVLMLTNHPEEVLKAFAAAAGFDRKALTTLFVAHSDIPDYMGLGDFAITPVKPVPTKRYCTPIKNGEYWALGLPVVTPPNISDDSDIIVANDAGSILVSFDTQGYRDALLTIQRILENDRARVYQRIRPLAEKYRNFADAEKIYAAIYGPNSGS